MGEVVLDESDSLYTNKVVCFVLVLMKCLNAKQVSNIYRPQAPNLRMWVWLKIPEESTGRYI